MTSIINRTFKRWNRLKYDEKLFLNQIHKVSNKQQYDNYLKKYKKPSFRYKTVKTKTVYF